MLKHASITCYTYPFNIRITQGRDVYEAHEMDSVDVVCSGDTTMDSNSICEVDIIKSVSR